VRGSFVTEGGRNCGGGIKIKKFAVHSLLLETQVDLRGHVIKKRRKKE